MRKYEHMRTADLRPKLEAMKTELAEFMVKGPKAASEMSWKEQSPSAWLKSEVAERQKNIRMMLTEIDRR